MLPDGALVLCKVVSCMLCDSLQQRMSRRCIW